MRSLRTFFVGGGGAEEDTNFFLIFFANLKLIIALNFSLKVFWRIRFTDTGLSFSMVKGLFLHLCVTECMQNRILFWTFKLKKPRPTRLAALRSFSNTHTVHVFLQSIQRFSEAVCMA